jgi:endoglucanase
MTLRLGKRILPFLSALLLSIGSPSGHADVAPITTNGNQLLFGGSPGSIAGPSLFWSNNGWGGEKYYTAGAVQTVAQDWNATLIRAAMGVDEDGGYLEDPTGNLSKVRTVVDAAIANDLYVIIDWHSHHAEDYTQSAVDFFQQMASEYGQHNHVIYEIYNEPLSVSWSGTIKPYAEEVISAIRAIDPDNLIVVGTPTWSQDVDAAANDPITGHDNIAYTLHFYAGTHTQYLRDKAQYALDRGIPLFATEWGTVNADGDGSVARSETDTWMNFFKQNNISHANWALNDKDEGASALVAGASPNGGWSDGEYTDSGHYVREIIRNWGGDGQVDPDSGGCDAVEVPERVQAEDYCDMSGVQTETTSDTGGGENVGWIETGDSLTYAIDVPSAGIYNVSYRLASLDNGAYFNLESSSGTVLDVIQASATGGWQSWTTVQSQVDFSAGDQEITLRATGDGWNINWFEITQGNDSGSSSSSSQSSSSSSQSSSSSSYVGGACDASNVVSNGATVTASQGQCIGYQHGSGQLRLGSWNVSEGARYDITDCNGNTTTDVAQVVNGFTAVPTDTANCTHTIYVRQAPHSYSLQFGSW